VKEQRSELDIALSRLDRANKKLIELTEDNKRLRSYLRTFPEEASYSGYLQREMLRLEVQYTDQQHIIEQYQAHFAKYGHFYDDYQQSHS
jgi:hypothetical protein